MEELLQENIASLFTRWAGESPEEFKALAQAGSDRRYFRCRSSAHRAIATYSPNDTENTAFLAFAKHFRKVGLPVPEIYAEDADAHIYLQEDLGQTNLLDHLLAARHENEPFPDRIRPLYQQSLAELARLQVEGGQGIDYSLCFPRADFDRRAMLWDLNYFKYFFLKLSGLDFDEQALEDDFEGLTSYLLQADRQHFMFRDFQARNIMIHEGKPWFIDFQGGRRGALQYDVASLLYQARAAIPHEQRMELLEHYMDELEKHKTFDREQFRAHFFGFVLIRTLQVLGAYGFRGFYERRPHFLASVPFALQNLAWIRENVHLPVALPELYRIMAELPGAPGLVAQSPHFSEPKSLTVRVSSFSYKKALPEDPSGNGGGFLFDCRAIHNPGRYAPYKKLTGRDQPVIDFLQANSRIEAFLQDAKSIVEPSIERYLERGFSHLSIGFGCTGGQHRSVYCADRMAEHLEEKYGVTVVLQHLVQDAKNWKN